jgi:hydrogenase maturation factor
VSDREPHCITCSDDARPLRVVSADAESALAVCGGDDGECQHVDTGLVGAVYPGQVLLVHAGVALATLGDGA